jgi:hypothetical protein
VNSTQQTALVLGCRENVEWCGGGVVRGVVRGGCNKFLLRMMVRMVTGGVEVRERRAMQRVARTTLSRVRDDVLLLMHRQLHCKFRTDRTRTYLERISRETHVSDKGEAAWKCHLLTRTQHRSCCMCTDRDSHPHTAVDHWVLPECCAFLAHPLLNRMNSSKLLLCALSNAVCYSDAACTAVGARTSREFHVLLDRS